MRILVQSTATAAVTLLFGTAAAPAQQLHALAPPPMRLSHFRQLQQTNPALLQRLLHPTPTVTGAPLTAPPAGSPWQPLLHQPAFTANAMVQLTDGSIMVIDETPPASGGAHWWKLTPDNTGSYVNGTWTQLASMQTGYVPLYFASAVLPDGRVIVEGGEYNAFSPVWSGQGSIYDPVANTWTPVAPPAGMSLTSNSIGDAHGIVLPNGTFMLSPVFQPASGPQQLLNATTLTWLATGQNNAFANDELSQALLQTNLVLTVSNGAVAGTEVYNFASGSWSGGVACPQQLGDQFSEMGPAVNLLDGTVFNAGASHGHNALYNVANTCVAAPDFPIIGGAQYGMADAPASILPSGKVLLMAGPGFATAPSHMFLYDKAANTITQTADPSNFPNLADYVGNMLLLPTGQVMLTTQSGHIEIYTDPAPPSTISAAPLITARPLTVARGHVYSFGGRQLNGIVQGAAYGDDYQPATNFPLVRITNDATHHVAYARTVNFSTMSITPNLASKARVVIPTGIETGPSHAVVVASGFASAPIAVTILP